MPQTADELIEKVHDAFADSVYPSGYVILRANGFVSEAEAAFDVFRARDWRDVAGKSLRPYGDSLPLLDPEIFRYYLPAFLLNTLCAEDSPDYYDILEMNTLFAISHIVEVDEDEDIVEDFWLERFAPLTRDQKRVVFEFLRYYVATNPVEIGPTWRDPDEDARVTRRKLAFWERLADAPPDRAEAGYPAIG